MIEQIMLYIDYMLYFAFISYMVFTVWLLTINNSVTWAKTPPSLSFYSGNTLSNPTIWKQKWVVGTISEIIIFFG